MFRLRTGAGALAMPLALLLAVLTAPANAQLAFRRPDPTLTDRVIVKWRDSGVAAVQIDSVNARAARLSAGSGIHLTAVRNLHDRVDVMRLDNALSGARMQALIARLRADPGVEYAEPDGRRYVQFTPNDPHFISGSDSIGQWQGQWYLQPSSTTTPAAIGATTAWDQTQGAASVVVAVVDTGVRGDHPDLAGKLLAGYDFVGCDQGDDSSGNCSSSSPTYLIANDNGLGWHADPTDPGDWIDSTDITEPIFIDSGCTTVEQSSWHGTRVAGIIGAVTNNGIGIAGVAPNTMILPVRAVGKCSGFMSDIVSAMLWAAGLPVGSLGTNPNPAKVINVSLGSNVPCSATEQDAVTTITAAGVLVVASAGNDGGPVNAPASCSGVLSVGGLRHEGDKVAYSSLSSTAAAIGIAAPAGNCVNLLADEVCQYSIETTTNSGLTTPGTDAYTYAVFTSGYYTTSGSTVICNTALINCKNAASVGTSFSAPLAAGVAALMLAVNPNLAPTQLIARMQSSALPFPTSTSISTKACTIEPTTTDANGAYTDTSQNTNCLCTTATCGAGMLNAAQAVQTAIAPFVSITASATSASLGQRIRLDGSGSTAASGHTIASYQWTANPDASLENANQPVATLVFPAFRSITVTLTITDEDGASASASTTIKSAFAVATGSGGGALGLELLGLAALAAWRIRARGGRAAERGRTVLN